MRGLAVAHCRELFIESERESLNVRTSDADSEEPEPQWLLEAVAHVRERLKEHRGIGIEPDDEILERIVCVFDWDVWAYYWADELDLLLDPATIRKPGWEST